MKWVDQPRKRIIRDIIIHSLNEGMKKLEDMAGKYQLSVYEKPLALWELKKHTRYLEDKGIIKHCPLTQVFMRTDKPYKFSYQV